MSTDHLPDMLTLDQGADLLRWNLDGERPERAPIGDIQQRIHSSEQLPLLPEITRRLLELRDDPDASGTELALIVEQDPLLAAQLLRRANSAYYGSGTPVNSLREAIVRVLGYEAALNLALALTSLSPLLTPNQGSIGRDRVLHHGLSCAALMQQLALHSTLNLRPRPGLIQLAGLTHNIGYLLLGHLLPDAFALLARLINANPELTLPSIERFALGFDHTQLGEWLFESWEMPAALGAVVRHHHNSAYTGEHAELVALSTLADAILADTPFGLGARPSEADRTLLGERLGLDAEALDDALVATLEKTNNLEHLT